MLVNNAGGAHGIDTVAEGKDADWEAMVQSNFLGLMRVTRACLPLMTDNPGSGIINIGSIAGRVAYEGGSVYCGVKAAEKQITQSLRLELNGTGVRVGTLDPGLARRSFPWCVSRATSRNPTKCTKASIHWWRKTSPRPWSGWLRARRTCCIDEILIKCTAQAAVHKTHRVTN